MAFVLPEFPNGSIDVGIAGARDICTDAAKRLHFRGDVDPADESVKYVVSRMVVGKTWSKPVRAFCIQAATWIIRNKFVDVVAGVVLNCGDAAVVTFTDDEVKDALTAAIDPSRVISLILATKVTFVMLNHHVGTVSNEISGYVGKMVKAYGLEDESGIREALWMVGHWADTRQSLYEIGYPNVVDAEDRKKQMNINITDDMRMRIGGGVAGAAKFLVYYAVYLKLARSAYGLLVGLDLRKSAAEKMYAEIKADPLAYHMGSVYLVGKQQIPSDIYTEEDKVKLASFVWAVMENSTLAKSPTLMAKADIQSSKYFTDMMALKSKLATKIDLKVIMQIVSSKEGAVNSVAEEAGLYTAADITEAKAALKKSKKAAAEKKEKAADEEEEKASDDEASAEE
jgi:hypothetical protein